MLVFIVLEEIPVEIVLFHCILLSYSFCYFQQLLTRSKFTDRTQRLKILYQCPLGSQGRMVHEPRINTWLTEQQKWKGMNCAYHKAYFVGWQNEPNPSLWLATMRTRWRYLASLGITLCVAEIYCTLFPYNKVIIGQACSVKIARYWPRSLFFAILGTSAPSRSINTQKRTKPIFRHLDKINPVINPYIYPGLG